MGCPAGVSCFLLAAAAGLAIACPAEASPQSWPKPGDRPAPAPAQAAKPESRPESRPARPAPGEPTAKGASAAKDSAGSGQADDGHDLRWGLAARYRTTKWDIDKITGTFLGTIPVTGAAPVEFAHYEAGVSFDLRTRDHWGLDGALMLGYTTSDDGGGEISGIGLDATAFGYYMMPVGDVPADRSDLTWSALFGMGLSFGTASYTYDIITPEDTLSGTSVSFAPYAGMAALMGERASRISFDAGFYYDIPLYKRMSFDDSPSVQLVFDNKTDVGFRAGMSMAVDDVTLGFRLNLLHQNSLEFRVSFVFG